MDELDDVSVVGFKREFVTAFAELNYEWIAEAYVIEDHDREILDDPVRHIIDPGGQVFFVIVGGEVAGTVAMINLAADEFELAKMAVAPHFRGLGIGNKLMSACIDYAKQNGRSKIILESNTKQVAAIKLYRKFGFQETALDPNSQFIRANIRMELAI